MDIRTLYKRALGSGSQQKIIQGIIWSFLGTLISKGFIFIALFLVARILTVDDYGKLGLLQSYINTFTAFSLASFGVTATKYLALYADVDKNKASEIYSLTRLSVFLLTALVLIFSLIFNAQVGEYIVGSQNMSNEVFLCAFAIFFSSLNGLQTGALAGLENFKSISFVNIVNGLLSLPLILFSAYKFGILGVVVSLVISNFSIWLCSAILLQRELTKKNIIFTLNNLKAHLEVLYVFSLPSFLSGILISPTILICNSILIKYNENGYKELALFMVGYNLYQLINVLLVMVGRVIYPLNIKNEYLKNPRIELFNTISDFIITLLISVPILIFPNVVLFLYGSKYSNGSVELIVQVVVLGIIFNSMTYGIARNYASKNKIWFGFLGNFIWAIIIIITSYFFVSLGGLGRAYSLCLSYLLNSAFTIFIIPKLFKLDVVNYRLFKNKNIAYIFLIMALLIIILTQNNNISIFYKIIILLVSYFLLGINIKRLIINAT